MRQRWHRSYTASAASALFPSTRVGRRAECSSHEEGCKVLKIGEYFLWANFYRGTTIGVLSVVQPRWRLCHIFTELKFLNVNPLVSNLATIFSKKFSKHRIGGINQRKRANYAKGKLYAELNSWSFHNFEAPNTITKYLNFDVPFCEKYSLNKYENWINSDWKKKFLMYKFI